ncbi:MAG: CoA-binding protein [Chloroflexota bacterium]
MTDLNQNRERMAEVLSEAQTIAIVGHSDRPHRTSYQIADYLRTVGYRVIAVNPTVETIDGEVSYASLRDVPETIDIVTVFRRSEYLANIVDEALAIDAGAIWTQLGVIDEAARDKAIQAGTDFATNLCIKVEHARLGIAQKS